MRGRLGKEKQLFRNILAALKCSHVRTLSLQYLSQVSSAAKVVTQVTGLDNLQLLNKAKHLASIHGCAPQYWQQLTEQLKSQVNLWV
jgi:hypothetical protein